MEKALEQFVPEDHERPEINLVFLSFYFWYSVPCFQLLLPENLNKDFTAQVERKLHFQLKKKNIKTTILKILYNCLLLKLSRSTSNVGNVVYLIIPSEISNPSE